jgi:hypothetical protein
MQSSQDFQRNLSAASLDAIGGEPLAGSGFETEEGSQSRAFLPPSWTGRSNDHGGYYFPSHRTSAHRQTDPSGLSPGGHRQHRWNAGARVAPWQKPWEPGASSLGIPFNPTSEKRIGVATRFI